ncbi:MAG: FIVAR domain-containing protein [Bacteroidales bacterium]|nr:FIVAR domain-containing protein [Bacteroidales bacterium]
MRKIKMGLFTLILMVVSSTILLNSCKKDEPIVIDKTALQTAITDANALIAASLEGTAEGQYMRGSKAVFQAVIDAAQLVYDNADATQTEVDNTVISIQAATTAFNANIVEAIAPEALMAHWTFDDGSGTVLTDYSGNHFDGTLMDGSTTWGGGLPTWTTDRYGNEGKALMFNEGAHVNIPYNSALNPQTISISVWVNAAEILENNRFMGLHSWNGYKFQLQSANKPFFTLASSDGIYDRDSDPGLEINTWYHLVVTFGGGNMTFYVNGSQTQVWDNTPGTAVAVTGHDLVFGQGSSKYADVDTNYDVDKIIPMAWGGYFHGSIDEVRIYNIVLTAAQVSSIYELEKAE